MQLFTFSPLELFVIVSGIITIIIVAFLLVGIRIIKMYEIAVILRSEERLMIKGPGIVFIMPLRDRIIAKVDLRSIMASFLTENVAELSKKVNVSIKCEIHYRITNQSKATNVIKTILRLVMDESQLDKLIFKKERFGNALQSALNQSTLKWNVEITKVNVMEIK